MLKNRNREEQDNFIYVLTSQILRRKLLRLYAKERYEKIRTLRAIEEKYGERFSSDVAVERRNRLSHGIVRRRNMEYKNIVDALLGEAASEFELYVYQCIESDTQVNPEVLEKYLGL